MYRYSPQCTKKALDKGLAHLTLKKCVIYSIVNAVKTLKKTFTPDLKHSF